MFINWKLREINLKIVYYGPSLSGKTSSLEYIHSRTHPDRRGELISLKTREDRTLGGGPGTAFCNRNIKQFRLRWSCSLSTQIRGDHPTHQHLLSSLVLRQFQELQRAREHPACGTTHVDRPHRFTAGLQRQRRRGSLGRSLRRVPFGLSCIPRLRACRQDGDTFRSEAGA